MTYLDSIILGVVEGLTEFIPVSSTGHLILASSLLGIPETEFVKTFEIAIQLGAILAVVVLYWRSFLSIRMLKRLIVAFIPTAVVGYLLYHFVKQYLLGNVMVVLWALLIGGLAMLMIEWIVGKRAAKEGHMDSLSYRQAFFVGLWQSISVIPGVSRSGATVMGGLLMNLSRATILEFSFLLAVPTMLAATAYDVLKNPVTLTGDSLGVFLVGFAVAFVVALVVIKAALGYVRKHTFIPFALYRIAVALVFFVTSLS
jgi:undecaprenyl-diphosphatase